MSPDPKGGRHNKDKIRIFTYSSLHDLAATDDQDQPYYSNFHLTLCILPGFCPLLIAFANSLDPDPGLI